MTNAALLTILNNLCDEASETVHATRGLMETRRDLPSDVHLVQCRNSADRLHRTIDDIRDLLADAVVPERSAETLDAGQCLAQTAELLNLASSADASGETGLGSRIWYCGPESPLDIRLDRQCFEQALAGVLDVAAKLSVGCSPAACETTVALEECALGIRVTIRPADPQVAASLFEWLSADLKQFTFSDLRDITTAIHVMVAGRRLRTLQGTVELLREATGGIVIEIPSQGVPRPEKLKILVAEDDDESYFLSEVLLQPDTVTRARNGLEAFDLVRSQQFDVVLMDVHMPVLDGYAAIHAIRDWETQTASIRTPIVILSTDDLEMQKRKAANAGCSGFLRKPLHRDSLIELRRRLTMPVMP